MIELVIPGRGTVTLRYAVFDVNGTLAVDGVLIDGVAGQLGELHQQLEVTMLTANTHGGQASIDAQLGLSSTIIPAGNEREQKAAIVESLGAEQVVAFGNGGNDAGMLKVAVIGIAVLGTEGVNVEALQAADVVVASIHDALDLLLKPKRLVATLRR
jgi:P-type E1-E2 ATPase